jgi:hypothetical protein
VPKIIILFTVLPKSIQISISYVDFVDRISVITINGIRRKFIIENVLHNPAFEINLHGMMTLLLYFNLTSFGLHRSFIIFKNNISYLE